MLCSPIKAIRRALTDAGRELAGPGPSGGRREALAQRRRRWRRIISRRFFNLGFMHYSAGRPKEAGGLARQGRRGRPPRDFNAHYLLGVGASAERRPRGGAAGLARGAGDPPRPLQADASHGGRIRQRPLSQRGPPSFCAGALDLQPENENLYYLALSAYQQAGDYAGRAEARRAGRREISAIRARQFRVRLAPAKGRALRRGAAAAAQGHGARRRLRRAVLLLRGLAGEAGAARRGIGISGKKPSPSAATTLPARMSLARALMGLRRWGTRRRGPQRGGAHRAAPSAAAPAAFAGVLPPRRAQESERRERAFPAAAAAESNLSRSGANPPLPRVTAFPLRRHNSCGSR